MSYGSSTIEKTKTVLSEMSIEGDGFVVVLASGHTKTASFLGSI